MDEAVAAIDERAFAASMRLLATASRELAASFDTADTIAAVGRLVVPAFASGFVVELDEGAIRTVLGRRGVLNEDAREFPLIARGRSLGTLRVVPRGRESDPAVDVWEELAIRIAVSVDASQIYAREHHVADTLQRALLPDRLPVDDRLRFDAAYLPGAQEAIVGGDWYDAFTLPDGRIVYGGTPGDGGPEDTQSPPKP